MKHTEDTDEIGLIESGVKSTIEKGSTTPKLPRHSRGELFVKGPIPWNWLVIATRALPRGKALHVAIVLWFQAHLQNSPTVKLSATRLRELGVDRHAGYRALDALEKAELVKVVRRPGRLPTVTLLDSPSPLQKPQDDVQGNGGPL
jgi:hypothetical protein